MGERPARRPPWQGANVFHCTLSSAPRPEVSDFTGTAEVLGVAGVVAGGRIGRDAVDHEIVSQDFLGEPARPGAG